MSTVDAVFGGLVIGLLVVIGVNVAALKSLKERDAFVAECSRSEPANVCTQRWYDSRAKR